MTDLTSSAQRATAQILAPSGRDAQVAQALLKECRIEAAACADLAALDAALGEDTAFVVVTEEAVRSADLSRIAAWVDAQPSWSDLPFVVLTERGGGPERNPFAGRLSEIFGNVTFLERPFHPTTFTSIARGAAKARQRQFEARARLDELHQSEQRLQSALDELRRLNETLEERVARRTAELERAQQAVLDEMEQRQKTEGQLRQAQKMEMIGQLTGGVAHDFNNLLMAVLGNLDLLRKRVPDEPRIKRLIDGALEGAKRGAALTQRLLAFARRQELRVEPTDLAALVRDMTALLQRSLGPLNELRLELPDEPATALIDDNQIELALMNLVVNARDAMPEGGTVTITLDTAEVAGDGDLSPGPYLRLSVADTGQGMDGDTLARAIEPFFTTKDVGKGTGLGLSMIHGVAVQMNGALRLASEPGRGTTAELWLPATAMAESSDRAHDAERPPTPERRSHTILLVDDDALIATSTADMLEDLGHDVVVVHSGARALEILESGRRIDLMITDYAMPAMTGLQLATRVAEARPDLPILLTSGFADLPEGVEINLPRLPKPYQQSQLAREIARALGGQPALQSSP